MAVSLSKRIAATSGGYHVSISRSNRRVKQPTTRLWIDDRLLWEEDVAPTRHGKEWVSLDITQLATPGATLNLRFRVVDKRGVGDHLTVTFLGPVRLRAVTVSEPDGH